MRNTYVAIISVGIFSIGLLVGIFLGYKVGLIVGEDRAIEKFTSDLPPAVMKIMPEGVVENIVDGDTLDIGGVRFRLALVDTPEMGEPGFEEAKQFTATICPIGSIASIDFDDGQPTDSSGRSIAVIYCGNKNLNAELWKNGYAEIDERLLEVSEFDPYTGW